MKKILDELFINNIFVEKNIELEQDSDNSETLEERKFRETDIIKLRKMRYKTYYLYRKKVNEMIKEVRNFQRMIKGGMSNMAE